MVGEPPIPDPVSDLRGIVIPDSHTVKLTWSTHGKLPNRYELDYKTDSSEWVTIYGTGAGATWRTIASTTDSTTGHHTQCAYNTTNYYRVRISQLQEYFSDYSNVAAIEVGEPPLLDPPENLSVEYNDNVQCAELIWSTRGIQANKFEVEHSLDLSEWNPIFRSDSNTNDYGVWGTAEFSPNRTRGLHYTSAFNSTNYYRVRVSMIYSYFSAYSNICSLEVFDPPPIPNPPSDLRIEYDSYDSTKAMLLWTDNSDNELRLCLEDSVIHESITEPAWRKIAYLSRVDTSCQLSNRDLEPEAAYYFRMSAENRGGPSAPSNEVGITIKYKSDWGDWGDWGGGDWGGGLCGIMLSDPALDTTGNKGDLDQSEIVMWSKHGGFPHINGSHMQALTNIAAYENGVFTMDGRGECHEEMSVRRTLDGNNLRLDMKVRTIPVPGQELDHNLGIGFVSESAIKWGNRFPQGKTISPTLERVKPPVGDRIKLTFYKWYDVKINVDLSKREYDLKVEGLYLGRDVPLETMLVIPCRLVK